MTPGDGLVVGMAGVVAGAINSLAGGGTLISFPALLATGMAARTANITSSVGLISGYAGGSLAYRRELAGQRNRIVALVLVSVLGGVAGAMILLLTPSNLFRSVVPYLILVSCLLLGVQPRLAAKVAVLRERPEHNTHRNSETSRALRGGILVSAAYGSYFGAGLGVLLLGTLGVLLRDDFQRLNALKGLLSLIINLTGVVVFVIAGRVAWQYALILALCAWVGGSIGTTIARHLSPTILRMSVIALGVAVSIVLILNG
jgi:uncharacterized protein